MPANGPQGAFNVGFRKLAHPARAIVTEDRITSFAILVDLIFIFMTPFSSLLIYGFDKFSKCPVTQY